jgi:hypothetical protein
VGGAAVSTLTASPSPPARPRRRGGPRSPGDGPGGPEDGRADRGSRLLPAPLLARLEAQAEELGGRKARLAAAEARVADLEAPPDPQRRQERAAARARQRGWDLER